MKKKHLSNTRTQTVHLKSLSALMVQDQLSTLLNKPKVHLYYVFCIRQYFFFGRCVEFGEKLCKIVTASETRPGNIGRNTEEPYQWEIM